MDPRLFPILSIALNLGAVVFYWAQGDFARTVYWTAAAVLTFTVTFWVH